ncbi:MAG TPA: transglycosylase SLT domain-containing protein [Anaeromyxobacteraceae bacterium]|nr:transglycosylase SLT domain-containing protein [Anaeromyxobacteraceae bacterium]
MRAELALGLALREGGRFAEAAAIFGRVLPRLSASGLLMVARFEYGQSLFYSGHPGAAALQFAQVAARARPSLAHRARWREADALLQAGAANSAIRAYQTLLANEPGAAAATGARLSLAAALRSAGQDKRAIATYRALWVGEPADPAGRAAGQVLRSWSKSGGPVPPPAPEEHLARAARLLDLALPHRALATLDELDAASPPSEPASRSALLRALALLALGKRTKAATLAHQIQSNPAAARGTRAGAELVLARVAARSPGRLREAVIRYARIATQGVFEIPGIPAARARVLPEEATYLVAWLHYDAGDFAHAAGLLRKYAHAHPRSRFADEARWFEAWSYYREGKRAQAREAFLHLAKGPLAPAALYWQARLTNDRRQKSALYRQALHEAPLGTWYALLAAGRLRDLGERSDPLPSSPSPDIPEGPSSRLASEALERAARMLGAGLRAQTLSELRALMSSPQARNSSALAQLAQSAGDAQLPFRIAHDHDHPRLSRRTQRWLYPLAFDEILSKSAARVGVQHFLYLAVMRRESAFWPEARSAAGAVGLVQLIPSTAERLASVYGVPQEYVEQLELPEVSLPLGAAYLGLLTERFGERAAVLAAYNAGPVPAAIWATEGAGLPLDEWVEDIPYRETRQYVKDVCADEAVYKSLWENVPAAIDGSRAVPAPRQGVSF